MIDSVEAASGGLGAGGLADALAQPNQQLDRDAFLRLLVAQLENQDPLEPQEGAEFVAQLAQFSSLEQVIGINDRLDSLTLQNQGLANTQIVSLVGQRATVRGDVVTVDGLGGAVPITFSLDGSAANIKIEIRDEAGRVVRTLEAAPHGPGSTSLNWDGRGENGLLQPAGAYRVSVEATTEAELPVAVSQESTGRIDAVSFSRGYPVLQLDSGLSVPVSHLLRVEPSAQ